jgi:hypothetical protein
MPRVEFEPTTPVLERAKTVHALDRAATVSGFTLLTKNEIYQLQRLRTNTRGEKGTRKHAYDK